MLVAPLSVVLLIDIKIKVDCGGRRVVYSPGSGGKDKKRGGELLGGSPREDDSP